MTKVGKATLALVAVAVVAAAVVSGGSAAPQQGTTVTIGWAYDGIGSMAPFDGPALATAKTRIAQLNRSSDIKLRLLTCNTQGNKATIAKACATKMLSQGADIIMTTCDVDLAAPVVEEAIKRGKLTVASCIGPDRWPSLRGGAAGEVRRSQPTPSLSTSGTSCRPSRHAGVSSAGASSPRRRTSRRPGGWAPTPRRGRAS